MVKNLDVCGVCEEIGRNIFCLGVFRCLRMLLNGVDVLGFDMTYEHILGVFVEVNSLRILVETFS